MDTPTDGKAEWVDQTTAHDRVLSVASTVSQPRSVQHIADEACVSEVTAREYLDRLADLGVLLKSERGGTPVYSPDPLHTRLMGIRDLLERYDRGDLIEMRSEIEADSEARDSELVAYRLSLIEDAIEWTSTRQ
jgi:DNA-binding GntR family transcriptional regulator